MHFCEALKRVVASMSLLCMKLLGSQNKSSTLHRSATSGNLLILNFSLFQNCWVTYIGCLANLLPSKVRKVRSWRRGKSISSLAALWMEQEAGPFCTHMGALGRAQGRSFYTKKSSDLIVLAITFQNKSYLNIFGTFLVWGKSGIITFAAIF